MRDVLDLFEGTQINNCLLLFIVDVSSKYNVREWKTASIGTLFKFSQSEPH